LYVSWYWFAMLSALPVFLVALSGKAQIDHYSMPESYLAQRKYNQ